MEGATYYIISISVDIQQDFITYVSSFKRYFALCTKCLLNITFAVDDLKF